VIEKRSNVTTVNYKLAIVDGDVSTWLGPSGHKFCAGLTIFDTYRVYPAAPQPSDTSIYR